ncbi:MAG: dihydropteroate synthase [Candidatus Latescibacteria bacterium]|nr:dihydropteroate synthase [Candidatus Latescibacterota bacterium]
MPHDLIHMPCGRATLTFGERTLIMGILNATPDSFFDGGRFFDPDVAGRQVEAMVEAGADLIDVGGESTRPAGAYGTGAEPVTEEEETRRVVPIIERIAKDCPVPISVDTTKSGVARRALDAGADLINDISSLRFDPGMAPLIAARGAPVVLMHMKGTPRTMQKHPTYTDVIGEVRAFLRERIAFAVQSGIPPDRILIDPGLGFGKRLRDNLEIIARLREFRALNVPLLIGPSRKAFVGVTTPPIPVEDRLEGTLAALALCVAHGADTVRVHDVRAAARACRLADAVVRRG